MKGKYTVIAFLIVLLGITVYGILQLRNRPPIIKFIERMSEAASPGRSDYFPSLSYNEWEKTARGAQCFTRVERGQIQILTVEKSRKLEPGAPEWKPLFLKGFNFGAALPGCFPAEFEATERQYYEWLKMMADLGANTIRTYTILPPVFYKALSKYNFSHSNKPVYLLQGVWAKVVEEEGYGDSSYIDEFKREIKDVIDLINGKASIASRPGHASGEYTSNLSQFTLAVIIGREWEPQTVSALRERFPERTSYHGAFFSVPKGEPMECWLAEALDFAAKYETYRYHRQTALSFVNWLPLDPMHHDSEWIEWDNVREYDNDLESINPLSIHPTPLFKAGYFASYHAYPYYPDFVFNDEEYRRAECSHGSCAYFGYLRDLVEAHRGMPVVVAEFGVPSSRSAAHFQPDGMHQGGHSEAAQGELNAHMTGDIWESGCAGAVMFEWMDEWFKHNWLVMDFELPQERNKMWHNLEDAEQNFGILAMESRVTQIDGNPDDWSGEDLLAGDEIGDVEGEAGDISAFYARSDASCIYFLVDFADGMGLQDWEKTILWIGINTYDKDAGDFSFPGKILSTPTGMEFLIEIRGPKESRILVDEPYDVFTDYFHGITPGYASIRNANGVFVEQKLLTNRERETLLGESIDRILLNRSRMVWGTADASQPGHTSLADICPSADGKSLEMRLPWALLNVTDPSSKSVLNDSKDTPEIDISISKNFRIYTATVGVNGDSVSVIDLLPDGFKRAVEFSWEGWEKPAYTSRLKESAGYVADAFHKIDGYKHLPEEDSVQHSVMIADWPGGAPGAGMMV